MKQKYIKNTIMAFILIFVVINNQVSIKAQEKTIETYLIQGNGKEITKEELIEQYIKNSEEYSRIKLTYEAEALKYNIELGKLSDINNQEETLLYNNRILTQTKEEWNNIKLALQQSEITEEILFQIAEIDSKIASIDNQIKSNTSLLSDIYINIAEQELQVSLSSYYSIYEANLIIEEEKKQKIEFNKQLYTLIQLKEQTDYYNGLKAFLEVTYQIENIKYKKGYSTKVSVEEIECEIEKNNADISNALYEYQLVLHNIESETDIILDNTIKLSLVNEEKVYDVDKLIQVFRTNNNKYKELTNAIESYNKYINNPYIDNNSIRCRLMKIIISDYTLQIKQIDKQIARYVKNTLKEYKMALKYKKSTWSSLTVINKKYSNAKEKFKKGVITKQALEEINVKKEQIELEYYQYSILSTIWEDILENGIYGIIP